MDSREIREAIREAIPRGEQGRVAEAAGLSRYFLSRFLLGKQSMTLGRLCRVCAVLGLRLVVEEGDHG